LAPLPGSAQSVIGRSVLCIHKSTTPLKLCNCPNRLIHSTLVLRMEKDSQRLDTPQFVDSPGGVPGNPSAGHPCFRTTHQQPSDHKNQTRIVSDVVCIQFTYTGWLGYLITSIHPERGLLQRTKAEISTGDATSLGLNCCPQAPWAWANPVALPNYRKTCFR